MTQREREEKLFTELGLGFATQQHNPKKQLDILWRHCLSLMERLERAEGIVGAFATHRYSTDSIGACWWCHQILYSKYGCRYKDEDGSDSQHSDTCPYRRAVEYREGKR